MYVSMHRCLYLFVFLDCLGIVQVGGQYFLPSWLVPKKKQIFCKCWKATTTQIFFICRDWSHASIHRHQLSNFSALHSWNGTPPEESGEEEAGYPALPTEMYASQAFSVVVCSVLHHMFVACCGTLHGWFMVQAPTTRTWSFGDQVGELVFGVFFWNGPGTTTTIQHETPKQFCYVRKFCVPT